MDKNSLCFGSDMKTWDSILDIKLFIYFLINKIILISLTSV